MKKIVLTLLLVSFAFNIANAQIPTHIKIKTINSLMLYKGIEAADINIPVYLDSPSNVNITYCWYQTKEMFGEKVRTSDKPIRVEKGSYSNGRLTLYSKDDSKGREDIYLTKDAYTYRLFWSDDGLITKIERYLTSSGEEMGSLSLYDLGLTWYDHKSHVVSYDGFVKSVSQVLIKDISKVSLTRIVLSGYYVRNNTLYSMNYWATRKNTRQQWSETDFGGGLYRIHPNGSFISKCNYVEGYKREDWFDPDDNVKCDYFEY